MAKKQASRLPGRGKVERGTSNWGLLLAVVVFALGIVGCKAEVYHGLEENQANRMVVALEQEGISADKAKDPAGDAKWMVTVPGGEKVRAWQVLEAKGLPRKDVSGFDEFYPSGGLIPTASEERILLQYATAQELRTTLLKVDGVVEAHVNLVLPEKPRVKLENTKVEPPRASVLVKYRIPKGVEKAPLTQEDVRRIVAGGVESMSAENVQVTLSESQHDLKKIGDPDFSTVGPVSVAPRSKTMLQAVVGVMGLIIVLLGAGIVFLLWQKMTGKDDNA